MAAAMNTSVSVMETAGEGGAWGMALLAAYVLNKAGKETLEDYLNGKVFANEKSSTIAPDKKDVDGLRLSWSATKQVLALSVQRWRR